MVMVGVPVVSCASGLMICIWFLVVEPFRESSLQAIQPEDK